MKKQLNNVIENYDTNDFYCISFSNGMVQLQGYINQLVRLKYEKLGFEFHLTCNQWIEATKHDVTITLTF